MVLNNMVTLVLLFTSLANLISGEQCLSLTLSGGGGKGGYEAGVLFGLSNLTNGPDIKYSVVSGVSIGAVNAGMVTQFALGDELSMSTYLIKAWNSITGPQDLFQEWPGGLLEGLLFQQGLFNNTASINFSRTFIYGPRTRNITVGSVDLNSGLFNTFEQSSNIDLTLAIAASGSLPGFFPPQHLLGTSWIDGGTVNNVDIFSAIETCLLFTEEKNVVVDVVYLSNDKPYPNDTHFKTLEVLDRVFDIHLYDLNFWYTFNAQNAYPLAQFRFLFIPSGPTGSLLNFSSETVQLDIQLGIKDADNMVKNYTDGRTIIKELYEDMKNKVIYP